MAEQPLLTFAAIGHLAPHDANMARALGEVYPTLVREGVEALLVFGMGTRGARLVPLASVHSGAALAAAVDAALLTENPAPCEVQDFKGYRFCLSRRREVRLEDEAEFARLLASAPTDRPFFVAQRRHPFGTVANDWVPEQDAGRLGQLLQGRHNAFVYSDGGYAPLADDHAVSQGAFGFTSVQISSFRGPVLPGGRVNTLPYSCAKPEDYPDDRAMKPLAIGRRYRAGVVTRVYADRVALARVALLTGETFGPDWVAPLAEYGALAYARQAADAAVPAWPAQAKLIVKETRGATLKRRDQPLLMVTFPPAKSPRAFEYRVTVHCREGGIDAVVAEARVFSSGIFGPPAAEPARVTCAFLCAELYQGVPLVVEVCALNAFGAAAGPLTATLALATETKSRTR